MAASISSTSPLFLFTEKLSANATNGEIQSFKNSFLNFCEAYRIQDPLSEGESSQEQSLSHDPLEQVQDQIRATAAQLVQLHLKENNEEAIVNKETKLLSLQQAKEGLLVGSAPDASLPKKRQQVALSLTHAAGEYLKKYAGASVVNTHGIDEDGSVSIKTAWESITQAERVDLIDPEFFQGKMTGIMTTLASGLVAAGDIGREAWVTAFEELRVLERDYSGQAQWPDQLALQQRVISTVRVDEFQLASLRERLFSALEETDTDNTSVLSGATTQCGTRVVPRLMSATRTTLDNFYASYKPVVSAAANSVVSEPQVADAATPAPSAPIQSVPKGKREDKVGDAEKAKARTALFEKNAITWAMLTLATHSEGDCILCEEKEARALKMSKTTFNVTSTKDHAMKDCPLVKAMVKSMPIGAKKSFKLDEN